MCNTNKLSTLETELYLFEFVGRLHNANALEDLARP
jgi:hypothetical protein